MPHIKNDIVINSTPERVWAVARDVESFPDFMPDVKSIRVLDRSPDGRRVVVEWVGIVKEFKTTIKWVEEDIWDQERMECRFSLVSGDYNAYSGVWRFEAAEGGTRFTSEIDFEYEVPLIGPIIKNLITKKMKDNVDSILAAIKRKVEEGST